MGGEPLQPPPPPSNHNGSLGSAGPWLARRYPAQSEKARIPYTGKKQRETQTLALGWYSSFRSGLSDLQKRQTPRQWGSGYIGIGGHASELHAHVVGLSIIISCIFYFILDQIGSRVIWSKRHSMQRKSTRGHGSCDSMTMSNGKTLFASPPSSSSSSGGVWTLWYCFHLGFHLAKNSALTGELICVRKTRQLQNGGGTVAAPRRDLRCFKMEFAGPSAQSVRGAGRS